MTAIVGESLTIQQESVIIHLQSDQPHFWGKDFDMANEKILRMTHLNPTSNGDLHPIFQMCGTTYPNKNYSIRRQRSKTACIEYVVSGKGYVELGGKKYVLQGGDTYFLPEGQDHFYYADREDPWEKHWVNFSGALAAQMVTLCGLEGICCYKGLNTSDLLQKIQYYAVHSERTHAFEQCSALLSQLLFRMSGSLYLPQAQSLSPVEEMMRYVERHAAEPLTVEQIADAVGKSVSQAERLFRGERGCSVYHYVLNQKISIACQLLTETAMTVKEISAYLSFNDEFYFSGLFRRKVGVSPSAYRARGGKR